MSTNNLSLILRGAELNPQDLRSRELGTVITALEDAIAGLILQQEPVIRREQIRVSLVALRDGSTHLVFAPNLESLAVPAAFRLIEAINSNQLIGLPTQTIKGIQDIVSFIRARNGNALLTAEGDGGAAEGVIDADLKAAATLNITGETTLYGEVLRLGGKEPKVEFQPFGQSTVLYCPASKETVLALSDYLYDQVIVHGTAVWDGISLEILQFTIERWEPYRKTEPDDAFQHLRKQHGGFFDSIENVDEWVTAIRRGDQ